MKLLASIAIAGMICTGNTHSQSRPETVVLDLTRADVVRTNGPIATEGGASSTAPQRLPLNVRLLSLTHKDVRLGEHLAFEIEVTNIGPSTFQFPQSVDLAQFVPGGRNTTARIYLRANRENRLPADFAAVRLAGAENVAGTLQPLEPGQKLVVRIPGSVALSGEVFDDLSAKGATPVNAVVDIDTPDESVTWAPAVSRNALPIFLRR